MGSNGYGMKKQAAILVATLSTSAAFAQPMDARDRVANALAYMRSELDATLFLHGEIRIGKTVSPFSVTAHWQSANAALQRPARLDLWVQDGAVVERFVGDGERFWAYQAAKKQYSGTAYATQFELIQQLRSQARGHASSVAALLSDAFGKTPSLGSVGGWTPWLPVSRLTTENEYVVMRVGEPLRTQMAIELLPPDPNGIPYYRFVRVGYWDSSWLGNRERVTVWTMSVQSGAREFDPGTFVFVPPRDAKPVSREVNGRQG